MAYYEENEYDESYAWFDDQAYPVYQSPVTPQVFTQVTTKIPPAYDGRTSWFAYEELVEDWYDLTELQPGPALKNRLEGEAAVYKPLLDREMLRDGNYGAKYFLRTLRPHFDKGAQSVFMWRFFQQLRAHRQGQDFIRWIGKLQVPKKRTLDAWMDFVGTSTVR